MKKEKKKFFPKSFKYIILNKPYGVLCQFTDESGRPTLKDYISIPGIYPAGRLDLDSEGLLLLTNDKKLGHIMSDPRYKYPKTYWVQVERIPTEEMLAELRSGIIIQGRKTLPAKVRQIEDPKLWRRPVPIRFRKNVPTSWLEITIREGMNRQIRKMTAAVGLPCLRLIRAAIGPIQLGELKPGKHLPIKKPAIR